MLTSERVHFLISSTTLSSFLDINSKYVLITVPSLQTNWKIPELRQKYLK